MLSEGGGGGGGTFIALWLKGGGAPDTVRRRCGDLAIWPNQAAVDELVARP